MNAGSFVAVAPDADAPDPVWFIKVTDNDSTAGPTEEDDYGNRILMGLRFLKGHFLERLHCEKNCVLFKLSKLATFFYRETIIYPFVSIEESKKGLKITNKHYTDILAHIELTGYAKFS